MTNIEYQRSRGLDHPFTATPEQVKRAWFKMNRKEILHRRALKRKYGRNPARAKFNLEYAADED